VLVAPSCNAFPNEQQESPRDRLVVPGRLATRSRHVSQRLRESTEGVPGRKSEHEKEAQAHVIRVAELVTSDPAALKRGHQLIVGHVSLEV
jgi:hypothetical protein